MPFALKISSETYFFDLAFSFLHVACLRSLSHLSSLLRHMWADLQDKMKVGHLAVKEIERASTLRGKLLEEMQEIRNRLLLMKLGIMEKMKYLSCKRFVEGVFVSVLLGFFMFLMLKQMCAN